MNPDDTEKPVSLAETLLEQVENYGKITFQLSKLRAAAAAASGMSGLLSFTGVVVLMSMVVLMFNIGIAFWLGDYLGKVYYGFFIIALFYLVLAVGFHFFMRKQGKNAIRAAILTQVMD